MIIGTPKELKNNEFRVGLTPDNVAVFTTKGHTVLIETGAGNGAAFTDEEYVAAGAEIVFGLDEILSAPVNGSGYNADYGLLGSNKATEDEVKLFPRDCQPVVDGIAANLFAATGKRIEVMVYGDGAFKDPVGKIWELADPVVSPAYTAGLEGTPNELKLKYLADNDFANLSGEELKAAISASIRAKDADLVGEKNVRSFLEEKAAAASYKSDYEMTQDKIVEYWLHLLAFTERVTAPSSST